MFAMKKLILAVFAITAVVATSANADAAFAIRIISSSNVVLATVVDGDAIVPFTDDDPSSDIITVKNPGLSFTIGNFRIRNLSGDITPSGPTASSAALGLNISATAAGSITFELSSTGNLFPFGGIRNVADSFATTTVGTAPVKANVSYQSWINTNNTLFSTIGAGAASNGQILLDPIPAGSLGTGSSLGTLNSSGTYSITTRTTFTFTEATRNVQYTSATDVTSPANIVPAPAGLLLSLLGLPALAIARRFRRSVPVQA